MGKRLAQWERKDETQNGRRADRVSGRRGERARGYRRAPEGMRRMPHGIGPHRGGVRSAGCDANSGSGRRLRRAGVAADCSQTWREKSTVVGIVYRAATVGSPGRGGGAGDPGVCCRPIDAPPGSVGGPGRCCEGARARAGGGRGGTSWTHGNGADGTGKRADAKGTKGNQHFGDTTPRGRPGGGKSVVPANGAEGRRSGDGEHI